MPRLILVRHGALGRDDTPRYHGHADLPLSAKGLAQAARLRERLRPLSLAAVYSSDLARCLRTAQIIAEPHGLAVVQDADLREISFGECEGLSFAEIEARFPGAERLWMPGNADVCFPGGESVDLLAKRVGRFLARVAAAHSPDDTVVIVSHGGPLRLLVCLELGLPPGRWWQVRVDLASVSLFDLYPEGSVLTRLNDVCHLGG
ncbi:MAG: histidine phosphatase family protein [Dehalococcoidales bacterium]|nr:histidine phosphatase family protein [Dehalococcoidales bacterium]